MPVVVSRKRHQTQISADFAASAKRHCNTAWQVFNSIHRSAVGCPEGLRGVLPEGYELVALALVLTTFIELCCSQASRASHAIARLGGAALRIAWPPASIRSQTQGVQFCFFLLLFVSASIPLAMRGFRAISPEEKVE